MADLYCGKTYPLVSKACLIHFSVELDPKDLVPKGRLVVRVYILIYSTCHHLSGLVNMTDRFVLWKMRAGLHG